MTADQLDLLAVANHPRHDDERDLIDAAILADGREHGGLIDQARVRHALMRTWPNGERTLTVNPRLLSARYSVLRSQGRIVRDGWHTNLSTDSGNGGKPYPRWRLAGDA